MKRVITAKRSVREELRNPNYSDLEYVQILIDNWSDISTSQLRRDRDAIAYCDYMHDQIREVALAAVGELGWDDTWANLSKRNSTDTHFSASGVVYTTSKTIINNLCKTLENYLKKKTLFNNSVYTHYFKESNCGPVPCYRISIEGVAWSSDYI